MDDDGKIHFMPVGDEMIFGKRMDSGQIFTWRGKSLFDVQKLRTHDYGTVEGAVLTHSQSSWPFY